MDKKVGFKSFIGIDSTFPGAVYNAEAQLNEWLDENGLLDSNHHPALSFQHHTWFERDGSTRDFRHVISVCGLMIESQIYRGESNA